MFLFPAKNRGQLRLAAPRPYVLHEASRILEYLRISQTDDLFFGGGGELHKKGK